MRKTIKRKNRKFTFFFVLYFFISSFPGTTKGQTIPEVIFHSGKKSILLKNEVANTIPLEDWQLFIMGDKNNSSLPPYRRGLYGFSMPRSNYMSSKEPWFMGIRIKESCRTTEVADEDILLLSQKFQTWFKAHTSETEKTEFEYCIEENGKFKDMYKFGVPRENQSDICPRIMKQYYDLEKFKIGLDTAQSFREKGSYYIRDRSCIAEIYASPSEILMLISNYPDVIYEMEYPMFRTIADALEETINNPSEKSSRVLEEFSQFIYSLNVNLVKKEESKQFLSNIKNILK